MIFELAIDEDFLCPGALPPPVELLTPFALPVVFIDTLWSIVGKDAVLGKLKENDLYFFCVLTSSWARHWDFLNFWWVCLRAEFRGIDSSVIWLNLGASRNCCTLVYLLGPCLADRAGVSDFDLIWSGHLHIDIVWLQVVHITASNANLLILIRIGASLQHYPRRVAWMTWMLLSELGRRRLYHRAIVFDSRDVSTVGIGSFWALAAESL